MRDQVTGAVFKVTKGAPHVILKLVQKANDSMISQVCVVHISLLLCLILDDIRGTSTHVLCIPLYHSHLFLFIDLSYVYNY